MYEFFNGKNTLTFDTRFDLINYLSKDNNRFGNHVTNDTLSYIGNNDNDVVYIRKIGIGLGEYTSRCYRVTCDGRSIFDNNFVREVLNHTFDDEAFSRWRRSKVSNHRYYQKWGFIPDSAFPDFRRGPWPYIHCRHNYKVYRLIRTTNELRQSVDPEYKDFVRKSRGKNLPNTFMDEPLRDWRNTGWKRQGHNKHQWEVNVKTRNKHMKESVYVDNRKSIKDIEINNE